MTIEEKKIYIKNVGKSHLVKELVMGADMQVESAVDYVYDHLTLPKKEFVTKYF